MSSNPYHNDPVITRSNYEEYLLLYVDDELTTEEKAAVDQFLLLNPDLQQELEILMQTKLPLEWLPLEEKNPLLSGSMQAKASEENLLLYIDNELNEKEKKQVEEALEKDAAYRLQYELLLKTKSDATEKVACAFKDELYRHEKRRIPVFYWRAAAAILLVVGISTFMITYQRSQLEDVAILPARNGAQPISQPNATNPVLNQQLPVQPQQDDTAVEKTSTLNTPVPSVETANGQAPVIAMEKRREREKPERSVNVHVQKAPVDEDIATVTIGQLKTDAPALVPQKAERPVSKPLTDLPVTPDPLYTYNNTNAPVNAVPAVADETEEKSRSTLKGILRKATRYVERRANINVTNDNEELVIGAVAISLK
jgi:hypothetical protein